MTQSSSSPQGAAARRPTYRYSQNGLPTERNQREGVHLLNSGVNGHVFFLSWDHPNVLRILPVPDPENPERWAPWRLGDGERDWGDWVRTYAMVRNFGDPGQTCILYDPRDGLDSSQSPFWKVYNALNRAVNSGQAESRWAALINNRQGNRGPLVPRPSNCTLIQAMILESNNESYDPPRGVGADEPAEVAVLSFSAGENMFEAMLQPGQVDPIDPRGGAFAIFFQEGHDPRERQARRAGSLGDRAGQGGGRRRSGGRDFRSYGCYFQGSFDDIGPELNTAEESWFRRALRWDDALHVSTYEEQVGYLLEGLQDHPDVLAYALSDMYGQLLPPAVRGAARPRRDASYAGRGEARDNRWGDAPRRDEGYEPRQRGEPYYQNDPQGYDRDAPAQEDAGTDRYGQYRPQGGGADPHVGQQAPVRYGNAGPQPAVQPSAAPPSAPAPDRYGPPRRPVGDGPAMTQPQPPPQQQQPVQPGTSLPAGAPAPVREDPPAGHGRVDPAVPQEQLPPPEGAGAPPGAAQARQAIDQARNEAAGRRRRPISS